MRGVGTDNVILGPMRSREKKMHPMAQTEPQTDRHGDSLTDPAQWARSLKKTYGLRPYS